MRGQALEKRVIPVCDLFKHDIIDSNVVVCFE